VQKDIIRLYSHIEKNGYKIVYLTARAISQSDLTRNYLSKLKQDEFVLPEGPILMSPNDILATIWMEVVTKTSHLFKIACLNEIKGIFNNGENPIMAGFGNRDTDSLSYQTVGVKDNMIFIVNEQGVIKRNGDTTSYFDIDKEVNTVFPSVLKFLGLE